MRTAPASRSSAETVGVRGRPTAASPWAPPALATPADHRWCGTHGARMRGRARRRLSRAAGEVGDRAVRSTNYRPAPIEMPLPVQLTMSGRPRERSAAEKKQMDAAAAMAKARMDSMVQQMDPKVRAMMAESTSAATGNLSPGDVPAYTLGSLVALSEELVAMIRSRERGVSEAHYDWVNVRTGAMGSFMLPAAMQVVGAGPRGVALMRVTMPDGEMQVATVSLATLLSKR